MVPASLAPGRALRSPRRGFSLAPGKPLAIAPVWWVVQSTVTQYPRAIDQNTEEFIFWLKQFLYLANLFSTNKAPH